MICPMKAAIDSAGRIVIPKEVRRQAGLKPGMPLDVRFRDGRVEIEPAPLPVRLVRRGRMLTARPVGSTPPLTAEAVEETRRSLRRGRSSDE